MRIYHEAGQSSVQINKAIAMAVVIPYGGMATQ